MTTMLPAVAFSDEMSVDQLVDFSNVSDKSAFKVALENEKEQKRQRHREEMVAFRRKRKQKQKGLQQELRRLEEQLEKIKMSVRASAACSSTQDAVKTHSKLRELVVEVDALRKHNVALHKQIGLHTKYQLVLHEACQPSSDREEQRLPANHEHFGWRVAFHVGGPSFHFYPFSRAEFDAVVDSCSSEVAMYPPIVQFAGEFLGWNVHHATVASRSGVQSLVARARFTKRVRLSLQAAVEVVINEKIDALPDIVTPMNWRRARSKDASTVVLQQFDGNSTVIVRNIPGSGNVNLRYICLVHRSRWTERDGKRVITCTMAIGDSDANKRSRAESNQEKVEWVTEGGVVLTFTEVGDNTTDVQYDHWGGCQGALHAQYLFVQWADFAVRWEQFVKPSLLLQG